MWAFIGIVAGYVWDGIQAGIDAIVFAIQFAVHWLFVFALSLGSALKDLGGLIANKFSEVYKYFRDSFLTDLKDGWNKFWKHFDEFRGWMKDTMQPVFDFLHAVRDEILCFYKTWIRPVLDVIDSARQVLKVLEALHVQFAFTLDKYLGEIEAAINYPFELVLTKLNEVINVVNRIVGADGLFQQLVHLKSLVRDAGNWHHIWLKAAVSKPLDAGDDYARNRDYPTDAPGANGKELAQFYRGEDNRMQGYVDELVPLWVTATELPPPENFDAP